MNYDSQYYSSVIPIEYVDFAVSLENTQYEYLLFSRQIVRIAMSGKNKGSLVFCIQQKARGSG